jgi:acyl-CoA reductase-like NAD-dependent aldehyde dehydrogenase
MRVDHLINGKSVAGTDYFETVNPATQEVLAEVASGGEAEVNAAVAAAKEAFPKWAGMPAPERAKLIRKLGDLIAANVPEIARTETKTAARSSRRPASSWCRARPTTSTTSPRCARAWTATPTPRPRT